MLTQAMPAVVQALSGALPPAALKQLTQALGNCQQPLTGRQDINLQPRQFGMDGGLMPEDTWDPNEYLDLLPTTDQDVFFDTAFGPNSNINYAGNTFNLPVNQLLQTIMNIGGNTLNVGGNTTFQNINTTNINTTNINNQNIQQFFGGGPPPPGVPGQPGDPGADGQPGVPGPPGTGGTGPMRTGSFVTRVRPRREKIEIENRPVEIRARLTDDCEIEVDPIILPVAKIKEFLVAAESDTGLAYVP